MIRTISEHAPLESTMEIKYIVADAPVNECKSGDYYIPKQSGTALKTPLCINHTQRRFFVSFESKEDGKC